MTDKKLIRLGSILASIHALTTLLVISAIVVIVSLNPIFQTEAHLRRTILRHTPMGSSMEDVRAFIDSSDNWELGIWNNERGYVLDKSLPPSQFEEHIVGEKYISAWGQEFIWMGISMYWAFDENGELIEVAPHRYRIF